MAQQTGFDFRGFFMNSLGTIGINWLIAKYLNKPKRTPIKPNQLSDWDFPTASETRAVPDATGRTLIEAPNTLAVVDYQTAEVFRTERQFLSKTKQQIGNNYAMGLALGLCLGSPGLRLREVRADGRVAWAGNVGSGATVGIMASYGEGDLKQGVKGILEFHSCDLVPSAYLERQLGVGEVPAYSHLCYVVFRGPDGGSMTGNFGAAAPNGWLGSQGSLPKLEFVLEHTDVLPSAWVPAEDAAAYASRRTVAGGDANPAYVLYRAERHELIGAGLPADLLDWSSFHAAALTLQAEGNGWSNVWDSSRSVSEYREEIERQINGSVIADPTTAKLRLRLIRETEAVVLVMDPSTIAEGGLRSFSRTSQDDSANEVTLQFKDRENGYRDRTAIAPDEAAKNAAGQTNSESVAFSGVSRAEQASALALREVRALSAPLARVSATVNTTNKGLRAGDVALFTWPDLSISGMRMRIISVDYRDLYSGQVDIEAVEDVFLSGLTAYSAGLPPIGGGSSESNTPPAAAAHRAYIIPAPWGLAQTEYDRPMLLVSPSTTAQRTFDVGYNATDSSIFNATTADWDASGPHPLMVSGDLSANLSDTGTSVSITLTAANGALLKTLSATGGLLALVGNPQAFSSSGDQVYEFVRVSAFTVSGDGLSATLTLSKRAIFDTYPQRWTAGAAQFWLIPRVVLDPSGLASCLSSDVLNGPVAQAIAGEPFSRPFAWMRNSAGLQAASPVLIGSTSDGLAQDGTLGRFASRAPRPVNAGEPKLDGITGMYSRLDTLPTVSATYPKVVSWKNRWKESTVDRDTAWATGTGIVLPNTIGTLVHLQRLNAGGTAWNTLFTHNVTSGAESFSTAALGYALPSLVSGDILRVIVRHYTNAGATEVWPYNVSPSDLSMLNNPRARHYRVA